MAVSHKSKNAIFYLVIIFELINPGHLFETQKMKFRVSKEFDQGVKAGL